MNPDENNNQPQPDETPRPTEQPLVTTPAQEAPTPLPTNNTVPPVAPATEIQVPPVLAETQPSSEPVRPPAVSPIVAEPIVTQSKSLSVASLILGILGFLTGFLGIGILLGLIAVVLGIISLVKKQPGKGMAITGLTTGALALLLGPIALSITLAAYSGIQERSIDVQTQSESPSQTDSSLQYYNQ